MTRTVRPKWEGNVTTCGQCGADTVDEQGVCHTCGWHAPRPSSAELYDDVDTDDDLDGAPSLGETRAAEVAEAPAVSSTGRYSAAPVVERTTDMPRYTAANHSTPYPGERARTSAGGTGRFCGTCGARVAPGEMYCGQCGSPVGQLTGTATGRVAAPATLSNGAATGWSDVEGDAPTEAFVVSQRGYSRPGAATPFPTGRYGQPSGVQAPATSSTRTMRVIFGMLCLVGSLVSAAAAVIVALQGK